MNTFTFIITKLERTVLLLAMVVVIGAFFFGCRSKEERQAAKIVANAIVESKARTDAKYEMSEAPRLLRSYEVAVFAAEAEMGGMFTKKDLFFTAEDAENFLFTVSDDGRSCTATAKKDIGNFKKGSTITSKYDKTQEKCEFDPSDCFIHGSSQLVEAQWLVPDFFVSR